MHDVCTSVLDLCTGKNEPERTGLFLFFAYREGTADRLPADHPEPGDEGGGEGQERGAGLRGHRRARARHHLDQGCCPN